LPEAAPEAGARFLDLLKSVSHFEIAGDGALVLITADERKIIGWRG